MLRILKSMSMSDARLGWMPCSLVIQSFAALVLSPSLVNATEPPRYFSIKMQDNLIGYATVNRGAANGDEDAPIEYRSLTSIKVALLGKERVTSLESVTTVDSDSMRPITYRSSNTTNDVVLRVESDFTEDGVSTWAFRGGDERGEAKQTELPPGTVVLGSNNFAHWQMLVDAAKDRVENNRAVITVYLPDAAQVDQFELSRKDGRQSLEIHGESRDCILWDLEKAKLTVAVDAETNEFLRLDLVSQNTVIEKTGSSVVKQLQKSAAEELLARHFTQSNVVFDDFMNVDTLAAEVDVNVIGSGSATTMSMLNTVMQGFEGEKSEERIVGKVSVKRRAFDASTSPSFRSPVESEELKEWLKPTTFIESDHAPIVEKALSLTSGAETRWDAVKRIGQWVNQEITYTIADTPSARLAFEKRKGDCGPHSTLMVAMLQAVGIPARLVGGLVYTPSFGGSFGQHAWVEVHMGSGGWIGVDPTTGEFDRMSATHIKLFEGMGGVLPASIKVTDYSPKNEEGENAGFGIAKPLAWQTGTTYKFIYRQAGKELGSESFEINEQDVEGTKGYQITSDVQLKLNLLTTLKSKTTIVAERNAKPISVTQELSALLQNVKIECDFGDRKVNQEISGTKSLTREIKIPPGTYCFDNNWMSSWVLICSQLDLVPGEPLKIKTYHPSTMQIIPLTLTPAPATSVEIAGKELVCFECRVDPIKNTFWITEDGRFVKVKQGDLEIELVE